MPAEAPHYTPYALPQEHPRYLEPTQFLDHEHPRVSAFVADARDGVGTGERDRAIALFVAVRDRIRYNPYRLSLLPGSYTASDVLARGEAFCIPKAVLLAAAARAAGLQSGIGLADVKNHLSSDKLRRVMGGTDVFLDHGFAVLRVDGRWLKAAPAFNRELCDRMGVPPTEFDGRSDALIQTRRENGQVQPMEYLREHGIWSDLPFNRIRDDFLGFYPTTLWDGPSGHDSEFDGPRKGEGSSQGHGGQASH